MNIDGLIQLRGINEFPISTLGHCIINIEFNSGLIPHKFFVVNDDFPIKSDGILGLDFLTKNEAVINCSKLTRKRFQLCQADFFQTRFNRKVHPSDL